MTKKGVIRCLLSVVLMCYLAFALFVANDMAAREMCAGIDIKVLQEEGLRKFVSGGEVRRLLDEWGLGDVKRPVATIDLQEIEDRLNSIVNIEHATAERLANRKVRVSVTPMIPVARVFDINGSYYINRSGKRLTANHRFRLDVPVITGHFDSINNAVSLIPLVERLANNPDWNAIVAQISIDPKNHDVILVPMIRGHVVNLGDTSDIDNKLERVMLKYHNFLPLKGWNYYDTISVKWGGQVVATRRQKKIAEPLIRFDQEGDETEIEDVNSMLVSTETDTAAVKR